MKHLSGFVILLLVVAAIAVGPIALIWSLNTLFSLTIPFGIQTWFAALLILGFVNASKAKSGS